MAESKPEAFASALQAVAEMRGKPPLSATTLRLYWATLGHLSLEDFHAALERHLARSPYMPQPSDLLAAIGFSEGDRATEAWGRLLAAVGKVGRYASVDLGPEANAAVEDMGGWIHVCGQTAVEDIRFVRSAFTKAITSYLASGVPRGRGEPLAGLEELDAQRLGLPPPPPARWLEGGQLERQAVDESRTLRAPASRQIETTTGAPAQARLPRSTAEAVDLVTRAMRMTK